jgi:hypothetical protein
MIPDKVKNISQRSTAVEYSVVIWVVNETLESDCVAAFNPSIAHNPVTKVYAGNRMHRSMLMLSPGPFGDKKNHPLKKVT